MVRFTPGIVAEVSSKSRNPDPIRHVKKLKKRRPENPFYSLRIGKYRAILNICDDILLIVVVETGHRSRAYRKH